MKFLIALCFFMGSNAFAETVDKVVAVVNTEIVLQSDIKSFEKKIAQNGMIDELLLFGQKQEALKNNRKAQMDYLINERIIDSEIKRLNLAVTVERVEQEIRDIAKRNGVSRNEMVNAVKAQGMNISDYQAFIKNRIERQSLIESEISSKIRVSDEDVMAQYLRQNPNSDTGIYEYTIAQILFNPKKGGAESAKERADKVSSKLKSGESFETLAQQNSEDPNFSSGGLLGTFKAGEFSKEMEAAVQSLEVGKTTNVIQSRGGYHILKLLNKKIITDPKFEREKEKIRAELFEKSFQKHFKTWLEGKREDSFVRINS